MFLVPAYDPTGRAPGRNGRTGVDYILMNCKPHQSQAHAELSPISKSSNSAPRETGKDNGDERLVMSDAPEDTRLKGLYEDLALLPLDLSRRNQLLNYGLSAKCESDLNNAPMVASQVRKTNGLAV